jgi:multidrug resistance efflux pump
MDTFKYIAEILKQFTHAQKIVALLLLLTSIIMLSLGPKMIDAMSIDNTEYKAKVNRQAREIKELQMTVDSLDAKIRASQRQCTNEIAQREEEFLTMLDELKGDMSKTSSSRTVSVPVRKTVMATAKFESRRDYEIIDGDTVRVARMEAYPAPPVETVAQTKQTSKDSKIDVKKIVNKIESMKARIKQ